MWIVCVCWIRHNVVCTPIRLPTNYVFNKYWFCILIHKCIFMNCWRILPCTALVLPFLESSIWPSRRGSFQINIIFYTIEFDCTLRCEFSDRKNDTAPMAKGPKLRFRHDVSTQFTVFWDDIIINWCVVCTC